MHYIIYHGLYHHLYGGLLGTSYYEFKVIDAERGGCPSRVYFLLSTQQESDRTVVRTATLPHPAMPNWGPS